MNVRQIVWQGALWVAVMSVDCQEARAGCSAVGCARIDWTEVIETDTGAAVDVHGAFAFQTPALGWGWWEMAGHFVAECSASAEPFCRAELITLRNFADARAPVFYDLENDQFHRDGILPVFLAEEGEMPQQPARGIGWLSSSTRNCGWALELPFPSTRPDCAGDCDGNWRVGVAEVISGIRMMVDSVPVGDCPRMDSSADGAITVNEVVRALQHSLEGCP